MVEKIRNNSEMAFFLWYVTFSDFFGLFPKAENAFFLKKSGNLVVKIQKYENVVFFAQYVKFFMIFFEYFSRIGKISAGIVEDSSWKNSKKLGNGRSGYAVIFSIFLDNFLE